MERAEGFRVAARMRERGTNPMRWALDHGHNVRSVNDYLYKGMGSKRGGEKTQAIEQDLIAQGYFAGNMRQGNDAA